MTTSTTSIANGLPTASATRRRVVLLGRLGKKFGSEFFLAASSVRHALTLLKANFPAIVDELSKGEFGYHVFVGRRGIPADEFDGHPNGDIIIMPALRGSKSGWVPIIAAVVIIALMWWNPGSWAYAASSAGGAASMTVAGTVAAGMAASLMMSGLSMMFSPQLRIDSSQNGQRQTSNNINGPTNIAQQGGALPVGYGEVFVSTVVVDAGIEARRIPV